MKKEKKLSRAEERRRANFEVIKKGLEGEGYAEKELVVSGAVANVFGTVAGIASCFPFVLSWFVSHPEGIRYGASQYFAFVVAVFLLVFVHELIHGVTFWSYVSPRRRFSEAIEFGFAFPQCSPYCTCKSPVRRREYVNSAILPYFVLGVLPCSVGLIADSGFLVAIGSIMCIGAGADILVVAMILAGAGKGALLLDHPFKTGLVAFRPKT